MHAATALLLGATLLAAAGCLGNGTPAGSGTVAPTAAASLHPAPASWATVNWTGFLKVGAAYEVPSHVDETNAATRGVWSPSFHYEVLAVPQALQVQLDWTATAGQLQFMVLLPDNGTTGETMVETDFADHGPLCARLPVDHLVPGKYSIMAHSKFAVDAHLAFSVSSLGGQGRLVDAPHSSPAATLPAALPQLVTGGDAGSLPPEPCAAG